MSVAERPAAGSTPAGRTGDGGPRGACLCCCALLEIAAVTLAFLAPIVAMAVVTDAAGGGRATPSGCAKCKACEIRSSQLRDDSPEMAWTNQALVAYHGTVGSAANGILTFGPDLASCKPKRDFGQGFYMTRSLPQAIQFANYKYKRDYSLYVNNRIGATDPIDAVVLEFTIDRDTLGNLTTLSFVLPTDEWRELVTHCRAPGKHRPSGTYYDVVYGPVSNYRYAAWPDLEQLSFHTPHAIRSLGQASVRLRGRPTI